MKCEGQREGAGQGRAEGQWCMLGYMVMIDSYRLSVAGTLVSSNKY